VEAAKGPDDMFMLFELTYPVPLSGYKIAIDSAKLRLFKIYQVCDVRYMRGHQKWIYSGRESC
jgi:hypothetical protein